jgi:8-oxo-dGTP pyrophosphatase MutT (NUDIX family)
MVMARKLHSQTQHAHTPEEMHMNSTNLERTLKAYLSAWEIDCAVGSTNAAPVLSTDLAQTTRDSILQPGKLHAPIKAGRTDANNVPKAQSYGGVLISPEGRVLLREPIDHLAGYVWTWPKGKPEKGETPAQTALREVHEETGYRARIIGVLPTAYRGTTRTTAFFLMVPVGEQGAIINETAQTRWVSYVEAFKLIKLNKHAIGRNRDHAILNDALQWGLARIAEEIAVSALPHSYDGSRALSAVLSEAEGTISHWN